MPATATPPWSDSVDGLLPELVAGIREKFIEQDVKRLDAKIEALESEVASLKTAVDAQAVQLAALREELQNVGDSLSRGGSSVIPLRKIAGEAS